METGKFFFSYARADSEFVLKLAEDLRSNGTNVWLDRLDIPGGARWDRAVEEALHACPGLLVVLSPASVASNNVMDEVSFALETDKRIVPILFKDCPIPFRLKRLQYIDFRAGYDDGFARLVQALKSLDQPSTPSNQSPAGSGEIVSHRIPETRPIPETRRPSESENGKSQLESASVKRFTVPPLIYGIVAAGVVVIILSLVVWWPKPQEAPVKEPEGRKELIDEAPIVQPQPPKEIVAPTPEKKPEAQKEVVTTPPFEPHGINNPVSLKLGALNKVTLDKNEEYHFKLSSPASDLKIFLDMRRADNRNSNLQSTLSVLDQDGGVIRDRAISFNEIDVGYRKTALFTSKQPGSFGFKLLNKNDTANFWLTVLKEPTSQFVPFFGELVPKPLSLGEDRSGVLDAREYVYYIISLSKGDYKVIVDFLNSKRENTNIQGYLALLDSDGGNQRTIIRFNEINVSYRKIATFSVKKDEPLIIKVHNTNKGVNYTVKIAQNQ
jgi:hypothetical protein